jgi:hypothetical protein
VNRESGNTAAMVDYAEQHGHCNGQQLCLESKNWLLLAALHPAIGLSICLVTASASAILLQSVL